MTADKSTIMGLFKTEAEILSVVQKMEDTGWTIEKIHSPIPIHGIKKALNLKKSRVGWFTLAGGITGFFAGFLLAVFTATRWNLIVGGKPVVALVPFFIVGFEFTILFAVFGNILGLISQMNLPKSDYQHYYDTRVSGSMFGITATCETCDTPRLIDFFKTRGGLIRTFDETSR